MKRSIHYLHSQIVYDCFRMSLPEFIQVYSVVLEEPDQVFLHVLWEGIRNTHDTYDRDRLKISLLDPSQQALIKAEIFQSEIPQTSFRPVQEDHQEVRAETKKEKIIRLFKEGHDRKEVAALIGDKDPTYVYDVLRPFLNPGK